MIKTTGTASGPVRTRRPARRLLPILSPVALALAMFFTFVAMPLPALSAPPELEQLQELKRRIEEAKERHHGLREERKALQEEAARISAELVQMAARMQALEQRLSRTERRIAELKEKRGELMTRLLANRELMIRLLAALQRLRRDPPPPFVTSPEDVLEAVRSALLMGAVLPQLDARAQELKAGLEQLQRLEHQLQEEREKRSRDLARLRETSGRMQGMLRLKEELLAHTRRQLLEQTKRLARLLRQARTLEELLAVLERERRREERGKRKPQRKGEGPAQRPGIPTPATPEKPEGRKPPAPPPPRLALADFARLKNRLPWPAQGRKLAGFGERTPLPGRARGIYLATRAGAVVTAPVNARVEMAGPFRTYGKLVILDVGRGYRILLAGLATLDVKTGDWVRAGEPLGRMGDRPAPATLISRHVEPGRPILYMEIRHHNRLRDPALWLIRSRRQASRQ